MLGPLLTKAGTLFNWAWFFQATDHFTLLHLISAWKILDHPPKPSQPFSSPKHNHMNSLPLATHQHLHQYQQNQRMRKIWHGCLCWHNHDSDPQTGFAGSFGVYKIINQTNEVCSMHNRNYMPSRYERFVLRRLLQLTKKSSYPTLSLLRGMLDQYVTEIIP